MLMYTLSHVVTCTYGLNLRYIGIDKFKNLFRAVAEAHTQRCVSTICFTPSLNQ